MTLFYSANSQLQGSSADTFESARLNPFEIIYDSSGSTPVRHRRSVPPSDTVRHSQIYQEIERSMSNSDPQLPLQRGNDHNVIHNLPPIVTIVDPPLRRSGSVVSSSASISSRNRIRHRVRMARRSNVDTPALPVATGASTPRKRRAIFPVRRRTSFKYRPADQSVPNFSAEGQLQQFLDYCYATSAALLAEVLPDTIMFHQLKRAVVLRKPKVVATAQEVKSSELATTNLTTPKNVRVTLPQKPTKRVTISSPIKESFKHTGYNPYSHPALPQNALDPAAAPTLDPQPHHPSQFSPGTIAAIIAAAARVSPSPPKSTMAAAAPKLDPQDPYTSFRRALLQSKTTTPTPFAAIFPQAKTLPSVTRKQISQMNRTLFLEVLLRRTIAAKIAYRLKGVHAQRVSTSDLDAGLDSSATGDRRGTAFDHHPHDLPRLLDSEDSETDTDLLNTNDLIEHNASLLSSELLPSPQISYSMEAKPWDLPHLPKVAKLTPPPTAQRGGSSSAESHAMVVAAALATTTNRSQLDPQSRRARPDLPADLYINDFNKQYFAQYQRPQEPREVYQLQPMNRSAETLSSSESESVAPPKSRSSSALQHTSHGNNTASTHTTMSTHHHRNKRSVSSATSSALHDLDIIANRLLAYLKEELELPMSPTFAVHAPPPLLALTAPLAPLAAPKEPPVPAMLTTKSFSMRHWSHGPDVQSMRASIKAVSEGSLCTEDLRSQSSRATEYKPVALTRVSET